MENSEIAWTKHTFNPWIGCQHAHPGCFFCYAEDDAPRHRVVWGPNGTRRRTSDANWRTPLTWNKKAVESETRTRVFCASLADIFEQRDDLAEWRVSLFHLIDQCKSLDWQLLTKRPEHAAEALKKYRHHCWLGTSVSNQETADKWIPRLAASRDLVPILFVSVEPIIGPVDITPHLDLLDWVIVGGESGPNRRPCEIKWFRAIAEACAAANVPCFIKQDSEFSSEQQGRIPDDLWAIRQLPIVEHEREVQLKMF